MKRILRFLLLSIILCTTFSLNVYAQPTASEYLDAARKYYNNPDLQLDDIYENMSWVGLGPATKPDKPGISIPPEYLPQTGEENILDENTILFGSVILTLGIILLCGHKKYKY